ncbi:hypothetical protein HELRODRAFT_168041 [Helobdella robusta]|uniref:Cytochrome P450 n=1 Tax=Helobdella robusta TaxID=6412 RepID=T1F038_HELRO|nr:hypothetical protein HELRODRAFT_168041 [Helobdella robusta]ESO10173.1 hypothetical protein HELRODRAFT_168041 [Helobdella robusta]
MLDYLIFAATVVVFLILAVIYLYPGSKKSIDIPGPEPVDPLEGNYPDIKACGSLHEFLVDLHETYGPICSFWAGPQLCVSVASPELFSEQANSFNRPVELFKAQTLLWGENSPFVLNGAEGRKKHAFLTGIFNEKYASCSLKLEHEILKKQTASWLKWPNEQFFPLYEKISGFVVKFLLSSHFGYDAENSKDVNVIKGNLDNVWQEVGHYMDDTSDADGLRDIRFEQYKKKLKSFISDALILRKTLPTVSDPAKLPIDHVLQLSEEEAVSILLLLFTNAYMKYCSLFTWMGYFLALEPHVQDQVRKELGSIPIEEINLANCNEFKYFKKVFQETLRCANIVSHTARIQNTDIVIQNSKIPANLMTTLAKKIFYGMQIRTPIDLINFLT